MENLVVCTLFKEVNFVENTEGLNAKLCYLKTKDGKELDFLIVVDDKPIICFEAKLSDSTPNKAFEHFRKYLRDIESVQLVVGLEREFDTQDRVKVRNLERFLSGFGLMRYV